MPYFGLLDDILHVAYGNKICVAEFQMKFWLALPSWFRKLSICSGATCIESGTMAFLHSGGARRAKIFQKIVQPPVNSAKTSFHILHISPRFYVADHRFIFVLGTQKTPKLILVPQIHW